MLLAAEPGEASFDLATYYPIFLYLVAVLGLVVTTLVLTHVIGPRRRTAVKLMTYESGMDPIGDARQHFDIKFYLIAILFLVFDVELLFLYPWAVAQWSADPAVVPPRAGVTTAGIPAEFRGLVFWEILVFIVILAGAFAYAWRKGVFEWR